MVRVNKEQNYVVVCGSGIGPLAQGSMVKDKVCKLCRCVLDVSLKQVN